jgi:hypothetical protein
MAIYRSLRIVIERDRFSSDLACTEPNEVKQSSPSNLRLLRSQKPLNRNDIIRKGMNHEYRYTAL